MIKSKIELLHGNCLEKIAKNNSTSSGKWSGGNLANGNY